MKDKFLQYLRIFTTWIHLCFHKFEPSFINPYPTTLRKPYIPATLNILSLFEQSMGLHYSCLCTCHIVSGISVPLSSYRHLTVFKRLHSKSYILCEFFHNSPISLGKIIPFSPLGTYSTLFCYCIIYHNEL